MKVTEKSLSDIAYSSDKNQESHKVIQGRQRHWKY